jgi:hypothetical protein
MIICIISWALLSLPTVQGDLVCFDDWPSESGNYKGPPTARRTTRSDVAERPANESVAFTVIRENGVMQVLRNVVGGDVVDLTTPNGRDLVDSLGDDPQRRDAQCCRFTWECYHFLDTAPSRYLYGKDAEKWKCCEADFATPKPECPNPPDMKTWDGMIQEAPRCTFTG